MTRAVVGTRELQKRMRGIQKELQPKLVAQATRAAMVPMMREARSNAPQGKEPHRTYKGRLVAPGFLKRNIKLRKMKFKDKTKVGYSLAARKEAWYGKIRETGFTHTGGKNKSGKKTKIEGDPWLGKAYQSTGRQVTSNFKMAMLKRIRKAGK